MNNQLPLPPELKSNSSFSAHHPGLQLAWDSTSLGSFKICPRRYYYEIIWGYQPRTRSVDLEFGILLHKGSELYHRLRADGRDFDESLRSVVHWALRSTWDASRGRAYSGLDDPEKNRTSLVRALVWYLDQWKDDPLETIIKGDGISAVELSFRFDSGYRTKTTDEALLLCGHLDRLVKFNGETFVSDIKTTRHQLSSRWFDSFSPDNQFSLYTLGAATVGVDSSVRGLIVDGLQIGATFVRSQRGLIPRSEAQIQEWYFDLGLWVSSAESYADAQYWPMNDKSCSMYFGCPFRGVCSRSPVARDQFLKAEFIRRVWDPLQVREG